MTELKIELVGKDRKWSFSKREVRIGRDTRSDVVFTAEEYPMVSRNHILLSFEGERCWVEDQKTRGGTLLNGTRIERALVSPGDIVRLSSDGPELRLFFSALVIPGKAAGSQQAIGESPTRILPAVQPTEKARDDAPTRIVSAGEAASMVHDDAQVGEHKARDTRERISAGTSDAQLPRPKVPAARPVATPDSPVTPSMGSPAGGRSESVPGADSAVRMQERKMAHSEGDPVAPEGLTRTDFVIMEKKLGALRNLVVGLLVMVVILGGMLINQNRMIERNRQELSDLKKDAFEQLMPRLSQKAKDLDARFQKTQSALDLMDGKIREAEDRFVRRLNVELPGILDRELPKIVNKYVDMKMREVKGSTPLPLP